MSVKLTFTNGGQFGAKGFGDENSAYRVTDSGSLQALLKGENGWFVRYEYASGQWGAVEGTRYIGDTSVLPGSDGSAGPDEPRSNYEDRGPRFV